MKVDLKGIKNIIFDLGGVILDLDFDASVKAFHKLGFDRNVFDGDMAYSDEIFYRLQTGEATPEEFREKIRVILKNPEISDQHIDDAWCAMLKGIPVSRIETLRSLAINYKVYLFSNTNTIHIDRLEKEFSEKNGFSFTSVFHGVFYSQDIHDAKPAVSSFQKVIELSRIRPEETLFVDDITENLDGAEKAGLKTFWMKKEHEMRDVFKSLV